MTETLAQAKTSPDSADEHRPAKLGSFAAQVTRAPTQVAFDDRVVSYLDGGPPVQAPVAIPIILRRGDDPDQVDTRRLEAGDRLRQINESIIRATRLPPERLADRDRTACADYLR